MCYYVQFGSSASKGVCRNIREPKNWGAMGPRPLWLGMGDPLKYAHPTCYPAEFGRSRSNA